MRLFPAQPKAALLLTGLFLVSPALTQRTTAAADEDEDNDNQTNSGPPSLQTPSADAPGPSTAAPAATSDAKPPSGSGSAEPPKTTNPATNDATNTPAATSTRSGIEEPFTLSETGSATGTNVVSTKLSEATITGGADATDGGLKGLPKLPSTGVPIPTAQVPPTAHAPYMQESSLPAGTVFIAVGAILGFFFICVLLWRGMTVWALKRNMKRAAERQAKTTGVGDTKQLLQFRRPDVPLGGGYREGNRDSMLSLGRMPGARTPGRGGRPATANSAQGHAASLFFSPTAQGASGMQSNRGSTYLPSGYYAAGSAAPGNGQGITHVGGGGNNNISMSNLGPGTGYGRARSLAGETPPDSPGVRAMDGARLAPGGTGGNFSTSTLDLSQRPSGRAPSAYLEDLFDEAGAVPGNYPLNDERHSNYPGGRM